MHPERLGSAAWSLLGSEGDRRSSALSLPPQQDKNFESGPRIKKSTGIPRSFMMEVKDPNMKGAMLTNTGKYAIPTIDA